MWVPRSSQVLELISSRWCLLSATRSASPPSSYARAGEELKKKLLGGVGVVVLAPVQCLWYRIREKIKIRTESVGDGGA